jgi:hypothetical protein
LYIAHYEDINIAQDKAHAAAAMRVRMCKLQSGMSTTNQGSRNQTGGRGARVMSKEPRNNEGTDNKTMTEGLDTFKTKINKNIQQ